MLAGAGSTGAEVLIAGGAASASRRRQRHGRSRCCAGRRAAPARGWRRPCSCRGRIQPLGGVALAEHLRIGRDVGAGDRRADFRSWAGSPRSPARLRAKLWRRPKPAGNRHRPWPKAWAACSARPWPAARVGPRPWRHPPLRRPPWSALCTASARRDASRVAASASLRARSRTGGCGVGGVPRSLDCSEADCASAATRRFRRLRRRTELFAWSRPRPRWSAPSRGSRRPAARQPGQHAADLRPPGGSIGCGFGLIARGLGGLHGVDSASVARRLGILRGTGELTRKLRGGARGRVRRGPARSLPPLIDAMALTFSAACRVEAASAASRAASVICRIGRAAGFGQLAHRGDRPVQHRGRVVGALLQGREPVGRIRAPRPQACC